MLEQTQKTLHKFKNLNAEEFSSAKKAFKPYTDYNTGEEKTDWGSFENMIEVYRAMAGLSVTLQEDIFWCNYSDNYSHPMECIKQIEETLRYVDAELIHLESFASKYPNKSPLRDDAIPFPIQATIENYKKTKDVLEYILVSSEMTEAKSLYSPKENKPKLIRDEYVNSDLIEKLRAINHPDFDLKKLVQLLIELNSNWQQSNYYTVGLIVRTIINHVPPIFGNFSSFNEVIAEYGNNIFKRSMKHLNTSLRNIADGYTHDLIRKREMLPNEQQIRFQAELDLLLLEALKRLI